MSNTLDQTSSSILKMIGAAVSFSLMAFFVKLATRTTSSTEVVFFRSVFGALGMAALIWKNGESWLGKNRAILILRGVFGFLALSMHFYAISELDLGTAVLLNYAAPIYVVIFARMLLRERIGWKVNAAILASFFGLFLLAGPQFQIKPVPILVGILSGIFAALAYVMIRFGKEEESPYTIIFYFTAISTFGSLPLLKLGFHWPNALEWLWLIGASVGAFFGQIGLTRSIQTAPISFVLPFSYLTPVCSAVLGALVWKDALGIQALIGGVIIVVSGISIYLFREKPPYVPIEE